MTTEHWLLPLLQTSDALFPTGAYAHSLGFEEIVRLGLVRDEATLSAFLQEQIAPAQAAHELPYLRFAHEAATRADLDALCSLDREISAWKLAVETRAASRQIGGRRMQGVRLLSDAPLLAAFAERLARDETPGHHLTVFALQAAVLGIPLEAALAAWFYQAHAAVCGAALKLIRIGQEGCQRALQVAVAKGPEAIATSLCVEREQAGWFNPMLDIASMRHRLAEERLFIS
jgi:urease accessory protein